MEPPVVHVTQEPLVVYVFVAIFVATVALALIFALPRLSYVPDAADSKDDDDSSPHGQPPTPWSTTPTHVGSRARPGRRDSPDA